MEYIGILLILLAGIGNPVQTAVNSRLRFALGTPLISSTVSFTVGLLVLMVLTLVTCDSLLVPASVTSQVPWWAWGGGVVGAVMLTALIVVFPKLGGVLTVLLPMIGQIFLSILIDTFGWFGYRSLVSSDCCLLQQDLYVMLWANASKRTMVPTQRVWA